MKKRLAALLTVVLCTASFVFTACGKEVPANTVNGMNDLPGKTIGVQLGTTGDIYASDYEKQGSKIDRYNKGADAIQSLKQGKVDCVIIDNEPAKVFVSKNSDLKVLDEPFAKEDYAISIKKGNTELTTKINGALKQLKDEGTIQKIIDNYIGENAGKTPYTSPSNVSRTNGTLTMATNAEFPPYESKSGDKVVGIDADIAQAISDKLGMELKIEDMAFDSILSAVQSGQADVGIAGMTVTDERKQNVDFSDPYTTATQSIIVRNK